MTDNLTTLQSLRDRVAKAQSGDREIDADIAEIFGYVPPECEDGPELCGVPATWAGGGKIWSAPKFTDSIDAALTWVERVLPNSTGNMISWRQRDVGKPGWCGYWVKIVPDGERSGGACEAYAPSIALAIILAGLDALIAKDNSDD